MKTTVLFFVFAITACRLSGQSVAPCTADPANGVKVLTIGENQKLITYKIKHSFTLTPAQNFLPVVYAVSFNHSWVKEPLTPCNNFKVNPVTQPGAFKFSGKDTIINNTPRNNQVKVDSSVTFFLEAGGQKIDSAFTKSCNSRARANTCITIDSIKPTEVKGVIQSYGFAQSINPTANTDSYAFSWSGASVTEGKALKQGDIGWTAEIDVGLKGKVRNIRQKAGSNDPINFEVHDFNTGLDTSGTFLSIVMQQQLDDDTLDINNYWKNDTVHVESDSLLFKIDFPSDFTAAQGQLIVWVNNGFVQQAIKTGIFAAVPLPFIGTPVPFSFPLSNTINFHYNLDTTGLFGNDSLKIKLFMYGNNENNNIKTYDTAQIIPSISKPGCNGGNDGAISLFINYGKPPYTYLWSNGATTKDITGISSGAYFVNVTDSSGQFAAASFVVTDPPLLFVTGSTTNISCKGSHNGTITLFVNGGTPPYTYLWNNGNTNKNRSNLYPGTYTVVVTDKHGCFFTSTYVITQPSASLTLNKSVINVKCNGNATGKFKTIAAGGTPPYAYLWNTGATTDQITNLIAGTYTCTVTDANGCTKTKTAAITEPALLTLAVTPVGPGTASALAAGGIAPYTYKWFTSPVQTTATATGLTGGNVYQVKVTDFNACTKTVLFTMPILRNHEKNIHTSEISIYPNPCYDLLNIHLSKIDSQPLGLSIYDATGKLILNHDINKMDNEINLSGYENGLYLVRITYPDYELIQKFVIKGKPE